MAKQTVLTKCPKCGLIFEAEYGGFLGGANVKCPKCNERFNVKEQSRQAVTCANCHKEVLFDATKGENQLCPVCHQPLFSQIAKITYQSILCPHCNRPNKVDTESESAQCVFCGKEFSPKLEIRKDESAAAVIQPDYDSPYMIWRYCDHNNNPLNRFPYASRLKVPEGMNALLLLNGKCQAPALPGSYLLSDSKLSLDEQLLLAVTNPDQTLTVDIFFVRTKFSKPALWADQPVPLTNAEGEVEGTVLLRGNTTLSIEDAKRFADYAGYKTETEQNLICVPPQGDSSSVRRLVHSASLNGTVEAIQYITKLNSWTYASLPAHRPEIEREAIRFINLRLAEAGLKALEVRLDVLNFEEDKDYYRRKRNRIDVIRFTEQMNRWESSELVVHQKDQQALSAQMVLGGSFWLKISDKDFYFTMPAVAQWVDAGVQENEVSRFWAEHINQLMKNVASNILQPLVDDTDADVRELHRYFHLLRRTMESYLNSRLQNDGLELKDFIMEQKEFHPSHALQLATQLVTHKSEAEITADMRAFDRKMGLQEDREALEDELAHDDLSERRDNLYHEQAERKAMHEKSAMDIEHDKKMYSVHVRLTEERAMRQMEHQDVEDELAWRERLSDLVHQSKMQGKIRSAEEVRLDWEQKKQLENAQLDEEIRKEEKIQQAEIRSEQTALQAQQQNDLAEAEHQRLLNDVMRRIAESNLSLQEKLDAYARLCASNKAQDENSQLVDVAKAKASAQYTLQHSSLVLSKEEKDLLEEMDKNAEEREERRKQAEFQREMQQQESQITHEMEKLKLEYEQEAKAAEMEERLYAQEAEIEKLKLMLEHYTAMGQQSADVRMAAVTAEALRAQAEKAYEANSAKAAREEEERRERARNEREDKYSEQAEHLLVKMWEIQSAMGKMQLETEQKKAESQAQVEAARAKAENGNMKDLIQAMEKMVHSLNSAMKRANRPAVPNQSTTGWTGGYQAPAPGTRQCPKCGKPVSTQANTCTWCGEYLG